MRPTTPSAPAKESHHERTPPTTPTPNPTIDAWFIGGPWNHRLIPVSRSQLEARYLQVAATTYRRDNPLPSGVPVFTALAFDVHTHPDDSASIVPFEPTLIEYLRSCRKPR
jgi:hypothetical protein